MSYSNRSQREAFTKSVKSNELAHAYIVNGGNSKARDEYIKIMVKEIFCTGSINPPCNNCTNCHKIDNGNMEDIIYVKKDGSSIKVDQIKELVVSLSNKPFTTRTVAIIEQAESMTPESQNKLLKSLEEPAAGTVIILSADNVFSLYPTVRSRCIFINMGDPGTDYDPELGEKAANIVKFSMSNKPLDTIFQEVNECVKTGNEAEKLLDALELFVRDVVVGRYSPELLFNQQNQAIIERIDWTKGYPFMSYLKFIETAKSEIRKNINWKYTLKNLIISFKQEELYG